MNVFDTIEYRAYESGSTLSSFEYTNIINSTKSIYVLYANGGSIVFSDCYFINVAESFVFGDNFGALSFINCRIDRIIPNITCTYQEGLTEQIFFYLSAARCKYQKENTKCIFIGNFQNPFYQYRILIIFIQIAFINIS